MWRGPSALSEKSFGSQPKHAGGYYNLGLALHAAGDGKEAVAAFREAIRFNPKHAEGYYYLGHTLVYYDRDWKAAIVALPRSHSA